MCGFVNLGNRKSQTSVTVKGFLHGYMRGTDEHWRQRDPLRAARERRLPFGETAIR